MASTSKSTHSRIASSTRLTNVDVAAGVASKSLQPFLLAAAVDDGLDVAPLPGRTKSQRLTVTCLRSLARTVANSRSQLCTTEAGQMTRAVGAI